jgi:hypothetical protein
LPSALEKTLAQAATTSEPPFGGEHPAAVVVVIVAHQVQEAVQRENAELCGRRVSDARRLTGRDATRDDDVAQHERGA